ncbi:MAG: putative toxin-antitoxin system toxin component, PIN family [Anaerolineae bacterium]
MPKGLPRVVIDTNVLVSGLLGGETTAQVIERWLESRFILITSEALLEELAKVIARPKLAMLIPLELICWQAFLAESAVETPLCRDARDYPVLSAAIAGDADFLITGDKDLKDDTQLQSEMAALGVKILDVRTFLDFMDT